MVVSAMKKGKYRGVARATRIWAAYDCKKREGIPEEMIFKQRPK